MDELKDWSDKHVRNPAWGVLLGLIAQTRQATARI